jgi:O-antigen/teichoic acid export membrane protein
MKNLTTSKAKDMLLSVSQGAVGLFVSIVSLVIIERTYGEKGLGTFSFLLSLYILSGFITEFGMAGLVERETAINSDKKEILLREAYCALFWWGFLFTVLFVLTAFYGASWTKVDEKCMAYLIIALTFPVRNLNKLRLAVLDGSKHHDQAAMLRLQKHLIFIVAVFCLALIEIPASFLTLGFLAAEIGQARYAKKHLRLPPLSNLWRPFRAIPRTLKQGYQYIFTDEALDVVLYMDFFILGLFVSSWNLGIYAEASVLVKIFLLLPMCLKPIYRERYCEQAALECHEDLAARVRRTSTWIFFIHALVGLYMLIYYPRVINCLFDFHGQRETSFRLFATLLPGLLYFSAIIVREPVYEAVGRSGALQKVIILIAVINAILNFYFIPFAGHFGAAFSTATALLIYFFVFDYDLDPVYKTDRMLYVVAGAAIYLIYMLFSRINVVPAISFWLIPGVLFVLLVLTGFFTTGNKEEGNNP